MSQAVSEPSNSQSTTPSTSQVSDHPNSSQGNSLQIRGDRYSPSSPTSIPSNAEIRALKAEVVGSSLAARGEPQNPMRFQGGWNSQAMLAEFRVIPRAVETLTEEHDGLDTGATESSFNTDLWYAQTGVNLARQKTEQLSFKTIRSRGSWKAEG